ncbi:cation transporter [Sphingobacteriales bacterium UPWRP_1]|nr:cation diffusion facilitator family transporter [Sphingobacteriales bacterium TSM_CSS]PSJ73671.1 cation transporter [Sphingobacteriales bacterium UPWRP_1]
MSAAQNIRIQLITVSVGIVLLLIKFYAFKITGSNAILTDALESIINVVAGFVALYSLILANIPTDKNHPYGHGKVEFLSAGFEGTLIFLAGVIICGKSVYNMFFPHELSSVDIGLALTAFAGLINYIMGAVLERRGHKTNSLTMVADGKHLKSDAYSSAGLVLGLIIIFFTKVAWIDNVVAMLFGMLISFTGFKVLRHSVAGIMDEADDELNSRVIKILNAHRTENWIDVHNLRIIRYGARLHIDCHLTIPWYYKVREAHEEVDKLEELMAKSFDSNVECFIHLDPCIPEACRFCPKTACLHRQAEFSHLIEWLPENVLLNQKHGYQYRNKA